MWIIVVVIWIAALVFASYAIYRWVSPGATYGPTLYGIYSVSLGKNETEDGWNLPVLSMSYKGEEVWRGPNIIYQIYQRDVGVLENGTLESIKNSPSGYGVRWFDKDNDNHLSVGDVIFISKSGGSSSTVTDDDTFSIRIIVPQQGQVTYVPLH